MGKRKGRRGKILIPRTWAKFSRPDLARGLVFWAYWVELPLTFVPRRDHRRAPTVAEFDMVRKGWNRWRTGISPGLREAMLETATAMDAGFDVQTKLIEDPRECSRAFKEDPCICPVCAEYPPVLPGWCDLPHSDGRTINGPWEE